MTIELEPITIDTNETDEERRRREALESLGSLGSMRIEPPAPLPSRQADVVPGTPPSPDPQVPPEMAARGAQLGAAYRAGQMPTAEPRIINDAQGREQQRVYPPGVLPPPNPEMMQNVEQRLYGLSPPVAPPHPPVPPPAASVPPAPAGVGASLDAQTAMRGATEALGRTVAPPMPLAPSPYTAPPASSQQRMLAAIEARPKGNGGPKPPEAVAPDYTGADVSDAIRNPLHRLGNALRAYAGMPTTEFRSEGQAARERDQRGLAAKQQAGARIDAQQAARSDAERRLALQERGLEADIANRAEGRDLERERNRISETMQGRRAADSERRSQILMRTADAQAARITSAAEREEAETNPTSQPSRTAQAGLRIALQGYPPAARERLEEAYGSIDDLDVRTARQVMQGLPSMFRDLTNRRGGSGGGGGQGARGAGGAQEEDALVREAMALGIPEGTARGMATESPQSRRALQQRVAAESEQRAREGGANRAAIAAAEDAVNAVREAMPPEGQDIPGVGRLDSLRGEGFFQSAEGVRMRTLAQNMVRRFLRLESGAAISDEEMASEMRLRGLGPGATEEQFRRGVDDLERDLRARIAAARPQGERVQGQPTAPRAGGDMVPVIRPDGTPGSIPRARLQDALRAGWRQP